LSSDYRAKAAVNATGAGKIRAVQDTYRDVDGERWVEEPAKRSGRSPFARDRARVVHSSALRRLAAKTQVVGPGSDDFVRTRLTHSLEVAQVARELGASLGCDPDVVETAALAHDLGHPPFGHNGERALDDAAQGCGGFEGNAQTLRILTRLEAKTMRAEGSSAGLNLTRAALDATTKYPWTRDDAPEPYGAHADGQPRLLRKFGVYDDDLPVFGWLRAGAEGQQRRCIEAQVMDLADDIAYCVHDVEDGVVAGRIDLVRLREPDVRESVWEAVREWYLPGADAASLEEALARLSASPGWPREPYDASRPAQAALKNLTSELIGRFCRPAEQATRAAYGSGPLVRYAADLHVPEETRFEIAVLKGVAAHFVMRAEDRVPIMETQRALVADLVRVLVDRAPDGLQPAFRADFAAAGSDAQRLRAIVDQVASLTDASAVALRGKLG
jgi:dGTPase